jgi:8-oxo-dGTP pyrophosphatase MutT (NUDIX family)
MFVNARAIIERETPTGTEIVLQIRNKPYEGKKWIELPGGRVNEFESLVEALRREVREETGLDLTQIEGVASKVETNQVASNVECLQPFAVYQTTKGPVDSMGVYFRCRAEGHLLDTGDETEAIQWRSVQEIAAQIQVDVDAFSWVDRAGLLFYLRQTLNNPVERQRPRVSGAVLRADNQEVLMVQHLRTDGTSYWQLPGGGVNSGEELEAALLRELREETGLEGRVERVLFAIPYKYGTSTTFLVTVEPDAEPTLGYDPEERNEQHRKLIAVAWQRLQDMQGNPEVEQLLRISYK